MVSHLVEQSSADFPKMPRTESSESVANGVACNDSGHLSQGSTADSAINRVSRAISVIKDETSTFLEPSLHATPGKPIHMASVTFNILQSAMGVGILSLAATFQYCGVIGAVLLILLCAVASLYSIRLLLSALVLSGEQSYEGLGEYCFGKKGKAWVQAMLVGCSMVALSCFLVPLKAFIFDFLQNILSENAFDSFKDHGGSENTCLAVALVLVIIPVSLLRKIDKLWFTSFLGIFFIMFFTVVSFVYAFWLGPLDDRECYEIKKSDDSGSGSANDTAYTPTDSMVMFGSKPAELMQAISIIACSYCCQFTIFPVFREVSIAEGKVAAVKKVERSGLLSMAIASVIYVIAALSGYSTWREVSKEPSSILACYEPSQPFITMCYFGMVCGKGGGGREVFDAMWMKSGRGRDGGWRKGVEKGHLPPLLEGGLERRVYPLPVWRRCKVQVGDFFVQ